MHRFATGLLTLLPAVGFADAEILFDTTGPNAASASYSIKDGKVLMQEVGSTRHAMVFDADAAALTMIDHERRAYYVVDRQAVGKAADKISEARAQMRAELEKSLAHLSPEQRKMIMEQQLPPWLDAEAVEPEVTIKEIGSTKTVAGVDCRMVRVFEDDTPSAEACIAEPAKLGIARADFETIASMFDTLREMTRKLGPGVTIPNLHAEGGMPVMYTDLDGGDVSTFRSVNTDTLQASLFEIPAEYERQDPSF